MNKTAEPVIFVFWYEFVKWVFEKTEKFPKKIRLSMTHRIQNLSLDILEKLTEARFSSNKDYLLKDADKKMETLLVLFRLSHDLKLINAKGYEFAADQIGQAGKMVGGWIKQQERKQT